jgi:RimJ/RimL family protein N-acetyltransferase
MRIGHWPLSGLRITTPSLELRPDDDERLDELADLAAGGVHDPGFMPFFEPWTVGEPEEVARRVLTWCWRKRAELSPERWSINFLVIRGDQVVGIQSLAAENFQALRVVETGSWVGRPFQNQGVGKEMRAAVLHLAFAGLASRSALSGAFHDNAASLAVSRSLGYRQNGRHDRLRQGRSARVIELRLTRSSWQRHRPPIDISIDGLETCLEPLGAT